jgi:hypothetical protein
MYANPQGVTNQAVRAFGSGSSWVFIAESMFW